MVVRGGHLERLKVTAQLVPYNFASKLEAGYSQPALIYAEWIFCMDQNVENLDGERNIFKTWALSLFLKRTKFPFKRQLP